MSNEHKKRLVLAAVLAAAVAGTALAQGAAETIAARRAHMHETGETMVALRDGIRAGQAPRESVAKAQAVLDWSRRLTGFFPPGTESGDTRALAPVWSDRAGFEAGAQKLQAVAERLVATAQADDKAGFADAWTATDAACTACHRSYRRR